MRRGLGEGGGRRPLRRQVPVHLHHSVPEPLAEAGFAPLVGSAWDSDNNSLAETTNRVRKAEAIRWPGSSPAFGAMWLKPLSLR
jgi:hypothetical protein